jgi:ADP-heptose:LPS heptosyltransferase
VSRPRLLVLRALGLGDLLTALPALRALADAFPGHHRVLAAPAALEGLARHSGTVDEVAPTAGLDRPLDPRLAGADVAVNLHGRGPRSHKLLLAARPRRLIAFANPAVPAGAAGPRWLPGEYEVARWCRLLECSGVPADPRRLDLAPPPGPPPPGTASATLIHPGAASAARRWPPERFAAVARAEADRGRAVVVTAGPGEAELADAVAELAGRPPRLTVAAGGDLLALARLVAAAGRVLCGDTGVAHLATALGTPSLVLFGPVSPAEWGPPPGRPWHRALWAGSTGDPHGTLPDPGLLRLGVGEVLRALDGVGERMPGQPVASGAEGDRS